jgi:hypothetical protein
MLRMTRRTPPHVNCLKIDTAKNRISSHVNDIILIGFNFPKDSKSTIRIDMRALVLNLLKIEICDKSSRKRSKRLRMSQGSILRAQNLNLGPGAQPAKNRKFLHVTRKSVIGPRIMQGPSLYAQNCSKLSSDPLKPCLLKSRDTCCM